MTGPEHYKAAERMLAEAEGLPTEHTDLAMILAEAQVHATLALAAATAYPAVKDWAGDDAKDAREWAKVTAP